MWQNKSALVKTNDLDHCLGLCLRDLNSQTQSDPLLTERGDPLWDAIPASRRALQAPPGADFASCGENWIQGLGNAFPSPQVLRLSTIWGPWGCRSRSRPHRVLGPAEASAAANGGLGKHWPEQKALLRVLPSFHLGLCARCEGQGGPHTRTHARGAEGHACGAGQPLLCGSRSLSEAGGEPQGLHLGSQHPRRLVKVTLTAGTCGADLHFWGEAGLTAGATPCPPGSRSVASSALTRAVWPGFPVLSRRTDSRERERKVLRARPSARPA